jgi:hypothetical protein
MLGFVLRRQALSARAPRRGGRIALVAGSHPSRYRRSEGLVPTGRGSDTLTADSHYQLANRLASAYKVASAGIPVVLLYLGFTGDTYFGIASVMPTTGSS